MTPGRADWVRGFATVLAVGTLIAAVAVPSARAAPGDGGLTADAPTLDLRTLGVNSTLEFYGLQGAQSLTVPVPRGLVPAELTAQVELPPTVRGGTLTVTQDNRTISRVALPATDVAPITLPLAGADVVDNAIAVTMRSSLVPPEGYCVYDPTNPLRLANAAVRYTGVETAPSTVAEFLPPVLQRLTIFIPSSPSRAESDAAVRLTMATVARYGPQHIDVGVARLEGDTTLPPAGSRPLERQIVIREGPGSAAALQGNRGVPSLLITGLANELTNQARLLSSNVSQLALGSKAVAGPLNSAPILAPDATTLRDLGQPGVNSTALTHPQVSIGLDQTRLGRPVHGLRVHLQGSYTPLPSSLAGQLVVSIAGETIDRWPAEASGSIDRWVDIPDRLLQRYTSLDVALDAAGNTGQCGESQPITLTIDGGTPVTSSPADPPVPGGFQSLPQALMPKVQVGIGPDAYADTARAVTIMAGLQGLSSLPIDTEVVPLPQALDSPNPAVVISADGWTDNRIALPVSAPSEGEVAVEGVGGGGERSTLTLYPSLQFGSLQTVFDGRRTLLVATSTGAAAQLDSLLDWLNADVRRWSRLGGTAVIAPPGRDPITVTTHPELAESPAGHRRSVTLLWAGAGVAVIALAAGVLLAWRRRRHGG